MILTILKYNHNFIKPGQKPGQNLSPYTPDVFSNLYTTVKQWECVCLNSFLSL